jgi:hypothetical protein
MKKIDKLQKKILDLKKLLNQKQQEYIDAYNKIF